MREINLTRGLKTTVDDDVYGWASKFKWQASKGSKNRTYYVRRIIKPNGKRILVSLHRVIMQAPAGKVVDHINHDGLDNRRENLYSGR